MEKIMDTNVNIANEYRYAMLDILMLYFKNSEQNFIRCQEFSI